MRAVLIRRFAGLAVVLGTAAIVVLACDDEHRRTPPGKVLGGGGGACEAKPGELPKPDCDNSEKVCTGGAGCVIDEARCGAKTTCLPLSDNKSKDVIDLRLRRLNIAAPEALAATIIQNVIVNTNLDLDEKSCAESGTGLFTWLMRVDRSTSTLITGGAPPSDDPLGLGFCFASFDLGVTRVAPLQAKIELTGNTFRTLERADVNIPIFTSKQLSSAIVLPIRGARIEGVTLSADGNCVGGFNAAALDPTCGEDRTLCSKWTTGGSLGGFITLEEADRVPIKEISRSLCAYLAADSATTCPRDAAGAIVFKGDFCSLDNTPGSCGDSVWLAATFAASAAKIYDGKGTAPGCSGVSTAPPDDAGAAGDAALDAARE